MSIPILARVSFLGCTYLLDVVVRKGSAILKLLSSKDQSLLVRWDTLLVLNLALYIVDGIGGLDLEGDGLARKGLYEAVSRVRICRWIDSLGSWQWGLALSRYGGVLTSALHRC